MSKYVLMRSTFHEVGDRELKHWKYVKREKLPNGKWRYYYDMEKTYNTVVSTLQKAANAKKKAAATAKKVDNKLSKTDRYMKAAGRWFDSWAHVPVADLVTGKQKPLSWQKAKESVDNDYKYGDPNKLLTDKYKKRK